MGNIPQQPSNSEEQANSGSLKSPLLLILFSPFKKKLNLFSISLFSVILAIILFISSKDFPYLKSGEGTGALFQSMTTGYFAWAIIYSYQTFEKHIKIFKDLIQNEQEKPNVVKKINHIYTSKVTYLISTIVAISLFSTALFFLDSPPSSYSPISFYITFAVFSLIAGFAGTTVLLIGCFMVRFSKIELLVSIFQYPYSPLRFIRRMQLKFACITTIGFLLGAQTTFLYWEINKITMIWLLIGIILVIGFFFFPQRGFHKKIKETKTIILKDISDKIQKMFESTVAEPNLQNLNQIKEMHEFATLISKLPSRSFDVKSVAAITVAVTPLIIMFVQAVYRLYFS